MGEGFLGSCNLTVLCNIYGIHAYQGDQPASELIRIINPATALVNGIFLVPTQHHKLILASFYLVGCQILSSDLWNNSRGIIFMHPFEKRFKVGGDL